MNSLLASRIFRGATLAASLAFAGLATADVSQRGADDTTVRVVYLGQSQVVIVDNSANDDAAPHALTGDRALRSSERYARQGQWIEVGQGRLYVPVAR